jgi:drug/metabolite transporter (DMT)-like permease
MLVTTCLFVCQDSIARILLKAYPATEIAFARFFVHMVVVSVFIAWRDPRLMISRRPLLQMLRSSFLLGGTLFGMFALKIMPFVDFSAIVWVAPVLIAALSVFILHEKVSPSVWASVIAGLTGVWVIIGRTNMDFSFSMLFPCLAALANALYQIATRLLHRADLPVTTLFYTALVLRRIAALCLRRARACRRRPDADPRLCRGAGQHNRALRLHCAALGYTVRPVDFRGNSRPAHVVWGGVDLRRRFGR